MVHNQLLYITKRMCTITLVYHGSGTSVADLEGGGGVGGSQPPRWNPMCSFVSIQLQLNRPPVTLLSNVTLGVFNRAVQ